MREGEEGSMEAKSMGCCCGGRDVRLRMGSLLVFAESDLTNLEGSVPGREEYY